MDRTSIEREFHAAEAALATARESAQEAAEAVEARYDALTAEGTEVGSDEELATLLTAETEATAAVTTATQTRDRLMNLLSRAPQAPAIHVNEPTPTSLVARLQADPTFAELQRLAPLGSNIGTFAFEASARETVVRALQANGAGMFAVGEGATGESLIAVDQRLFPPVEIPRRKVRMLDLITVAATDSNVVKYGKQTARTDAAAPTALATAFSNATYTWSNVSANVENIGQYVKAPRETLLDIPAFQSLIEQQLAYGVMLEAESLIYSGDGTGLNYSGITTEAAAGSFSITRDATNERRLSALSRAIAAVRVSLFDEPTAIVMHPNDYHAVLVEESTAGGFLLAASAQAQEQPSLWGLPVVTTTLATEGEALVGNFKLGATLWVRSGTELQVSESNEDDFLKRLVAIRAEFRAAFAVQRPHAFCLVENFS